MPNQNRNRRRDSKKYALDLDPRAIKLVMSLGGL